MVDRLVESGAAELEHLPRLGRRRDLGAVVTKTYSESYPTRASIEGENEEWIKRRRAEKAKAVKK